MQMQISDSEYRELEGINASLLKRFVNPKPSNITEESLYYEEDSKALLIGGIVDSFLTDINKLEQVYYISDMDNKPSDAIISICKNLFDDGITLENKDLVLSYAREVGYNNRYKDDTLYDDVVKKGEAYYNSLVLSKDKKIISKEEYDKSLRTVNSLITHQYTSMFFEGKLFEETKFQQVWTAQYQGFTLKGMTDGYIPSKNTLYDIKTTGKSTLDFKDAIRDYHYDLQAYVYMLLAELNGVNINTFLFIVESTKSPGLPLKYVLERGDSCYLSGKAKFEQALKNYQLYTDTGVMCPYDVYANEGFISLKTYESN